MTSLSRFWRCRGWTSFAAAVASALACSSSGLQGTGTDANSTGGTGTGGTGGSGATQDAGSADTGASTDAGSADGDVCPPPTYGDVVFGYQVPPCNAPRTAGGAWIAEAGWSQPVIRDISLSGDRLVAASRSGLKASRTDTGWTANWFVWHHDEAINWAAVDGDTLAYVWWQIALGSSLSLVNWHGDDTSVDHALSGNTLVTTDRVFANAGGTWGPSTIAHPAPDRPAGVVALGSDRFALLRDAETRIVERQDDAWKDLGTLPAARSIAMSPPGGDGSWLVLSGAAAVDGASTVSVYALGAAGWQQHATLDPPAVAVPGFGTQVSVSRPHPGAANDPGIIVVSGGPTTIIYARDADGTVREQDRLPLEGKALASGSNLAILSTKRIVIGGLGLDTAVFVYRATF